MEAKVRVPVDISEEDLTELKRIAREDELRGLLEQWSKLEPERCRVAEGADFCLSSKTYERGYMIYLYDTEMEPENPYIIQSVVQEAIQVRRWHLALDLYPDGSWGADLFADSGVRLGTASSDVAGSGAITLLTAYLKALKA